MRQGSTKHLRLADRYTKASAVGWRRLVSAALAYNRAMARFDGFADDSGKFFKALAKNQNRDWFLAHKEDFEAGWNQPMKDLLGELRDAIDGSYPHCDLDEPKVFRIFRDVRFLKDKSPYKTFVAGCIPVKRSAKVTETPAAIYMHFGTDNVVASGLYMMDGPAL